jgi:hypothetical protein
MAGPDIPLDILRLTEAFVFASPEPVTETMLRPLLPDHLAPLDVLDALRLLILSWGFIFHRSASAMPDSDWRGRAGGAA